MFNFELYFTINLLSNRGNVVELSNFVVITNKLQKKNEIAHLKLIKR